MDTIYIVGKGAIGKALAVFLKLNNKSVILLRGSVDQGSRQAEEISVTMNDQSVLKATIEIDTITNIKEFNGIVVLTNKSFGNVELARSLKQKIAGSPVVILQNGLGVEQPFLDANFPSVYRCVLFVTSQNIGNGVRFKPVSPCPVGIVNGNDDQLKNIVDTLTTSQFQFRSDNNIELVTWRKAIINCAFNSICPLLDTDNGVFHRNEEALAMARKVVDECLVVAGRKNIELNANDVIENLLLISKSSDGQLISTLQDIRNRQPTEIDTLNFYVAKTAESFGESVPTTKLLGELTRLKSKLAMN